MRKALRVKSPVGGISCHDTLQMIVIFGLKKTAWVSLHPHPGTDSLSHQGSGLRRHYGGNFNALKRARPPIAAVAVLARLAGLTALHWVDRALKAQAVWCAHALKSVLNRYYINSCLRSLCLTPRLI